MFTTVQNFGNGKILKMFLKKSLMQRLHLFDQKYSKNVKYYYSFK